MRVVVRILAAISAALLLAGAGGVIAEHMGSSGLSPRPSRMPTTATSTAPTTTGAPPVAPAVPSEATLEAELIVPNDLGGYYTPMASASASQLVASGCLAGLSRPVGAAHLAVQYLRVLVYQGDLPFINEQISDFGDVRGATMVFSSLASSLRSCRSPAVSLPIGTATVALAPLAVADLGDQAQGAQGNFAEAGRNGQLTVAVVRAGTTIVVFEYGDARPPSNPILGTVMSTLRSTVGKALP